jgi:hypothetical protein
MNPYRETQRKSENSEKDWPYGRLFAVFGVMVAMGLALAACTNGMSLFLIPTALVLQSWNYGKSGHQPID